MELNSFLEALSALSQASRLELFQLLASREPEGVTVGELARLAGVPQSTMSARLSVLAHAGLVRGRRKCQSVIYHADLGRLREVREFLAEAGRAPACTAASEVTPGAGIAVRQPAA